MIRFSSIVMALCLLVSLAAAQPTPIEVMSHKQDTLVAIKGPKGKVLADGSLLYVVRLLKGQPETPKPGGLGDNEQLIIKSEINPFKSYPGEIEMVVTVCDRDEFLQQNQAVKNESVIFRVFDSRDSTLAKGTWYADSPQYVMPTMPGSIQGLHFGSWKQIP